MKKLFNRYVALFFIIVILLIGIYFLYRNSIYSNISIISAKDIFSKEIIQNNDNNKIEDVGNINKNYAVDYEMIKYENESERAKKILNVPIVAEVQVFLDEGSYGDNVYYFSNKLDDIKYINNYITNIDEYQYPNQKKGYEYEKVTFVLKNKSVDYKYIYINEDIINYIKNNFEKKKIYLSEDAKLGCTSENIYDCLNYSNDEYKNIIKCLTKISPLYQGYEVKNGKVTRYSVADDLIWASQFENGAEVSYAYKMTDSKELVEIMDRLNAKKFKEIIENDNRISQIKLNEYKDNKLLNRYNTESVKESLIKYAKEHYNENYPKNDYFIIWVFLENDLFSYLKVPATQENRKMILDIGGKIYED